MEYIGNPRPVKCKPVFVKSPLLQQPVKEITMALLRAVEAGRVAQAARLAEWAADEAARARAAKDHGGEATVP